ncbi:MAG: penicillin-binding transpeptidase domain-containing protein [Bacillota bacterium]|nr:penicillin-binding transpeptidase domain-containing protein [Bacillota bacterium]
MRRQAPFLICCLVLIFFSLISFRLGRIMLGQGEELAAVANAQQIRSLDYYQYARGDILDRKNRNITNVQENCLLLHPAMLEDRRAAQIFLADVLDLPLEQLSSRFPGEDTPGFCVFKTGIPAEQAREIQEAKLPGVSCLQLAARYSSSQPATQLIGSCRWEEGRWRGVSGLEAIYDSDLTGRQDKQIIAYVDADGQMSQENFYLLEEEPQYNRLELCLDLDYQQIAENAFRSAGHTGACVILDPENGDLLAAASVPGYDPYFFQDLEKDAYVNKVFSLYPPASTFKCLLAAAALNEGLSLPGAADSQASHRLQQELASGREEETESVPEPAEENIPGEEEGVFVCSGSYYFGDGRCVRCTSAANGHGPLDLGKALAVSCNCYFVALGQSMGGELIRKYCGKLGLCSQQLIAYPLAEDSPEDYLDFDDSVPADLANVSLGERGVMLSPLQEAVFYAALANGGRLPQARLLQRISSSSGEVLREFPAEEPEQVLDAEVAEQIREMLVQAVEKGTANALSQSSEGAGAKTGTSESGGVWISGFVPAGEPQLVIVVHVDQGVAGGIEAAEIFHRIVQDIYALEGELEQA